MPFITNRWTEREVQIMNDLLKEYGKEGLSSGFRRLSPILNRDWRAIKAKYYYNNYNNPITVNCPTTECSLSVQEGKIFCEKHKTYLTIAKDWENQGEQIPMRHILCIAYSNGKNKEVLIDEEC